MFGIINYFSKLLKESKIENENCPFCKSDKIILKSLVKDNGGYVGHYKETIVFSTAFCYECGIMYLDRFKTGTMFIDGDKEICGDPTPFVWHMFSPDDIHSPPRWDVNSDLTRYAIVAEAINYYIK